MLFKSTNGGDSVEPETAHMSGDHRKPRRVTREIRDSSMAASESYSDFYYYYPFGAFARSTDSGEPFEETATAETWTVSEPSPWIPTSTRRVFVGLTGNPRDDQRREFGGRTTAE